MLNNVNLFVTALSSLIQVCTHDSSLCLFVLKAGVSRCGDQMFKTLCAAIFRYLTQDDHGLWLSRELVGMWVWMCTGLPFMTLGLGCLPTQLPLQTNWKYFVGICPLVYTNSIPEHILMSVKNTYTDNKDIYVYFQRFYNRDVWDSKGWYLRAESNREATSPPYYIPYPSPRGTLRQRGHLA